MWAGFFFFLAFFVAFFFRDPIRVPPDDPCEIVSPADGRVVVVEQDSGGGQMIGIFLSIFNVHINRSPVTGAIRQTAYREGSFLAAFNKEAAQANEQNAIDIQTDSGENFRVVQIAGLIARRIVCWKREGDQLDRGERLGLIQFGSRTDLHLPPGYEVTVEKGDSVFLLPNLFTTGSFFAGFYAIIAAIQGDFWMASLAILIAIVLDGLDGAVARLTNTTSAFGLQYDSLCDLVAFGVAPAILMYKWALAPFGRIGWLAGFIFAACAALRLARFNVFTQKAGDGADFRGLPAPAAAGVLASWVFLVEDLSINEYIPLAITVAFAYGLAFLMVSTVRYKSFKKLDGRLKRPFRALVGAVLALFVAAAIPQVVAFLVMIAYAMSGPVFILARLRRRKETPAQSDPAPAEAP
jgi:CDP-diacylglycerol--serine O-phosphatidyltransferase